MAIDRASGTPLMVEQRILRAENLSRRRKLLDLLLCLRDAEECEQDAEGMRALAKIDGADRGRAGRKEIQGKEAGLIA